MKTLDKALPIPAEALEDRLRSGGVPDCIFTSALGQGATRCRLLLQNRGQILIRGLIRFQIL